MGRVFSWIKNTDIGTKISYSVLLLSLIISFLIISVRNKNNNQATISQSYVTPTSVNTFITPTQIIADSDIQKNNDGNISSKISTETITPTIPLSPISKSTLTKTITSTPTATPTPTPTPTLILISTLFPTSITYPEKINFSSSRLVLYKGQIKQLSVIYEPENVINKEVIWSVNNGNILSVTGDGLITALNTGMATVTVTSKNGLMDEMTILILSSQEQINKYTK